MPTTSRSSPTTTRAVNEKRRPPLTTLATRLISTTRSWRSRPAALNERSLGIDIGRERVAGRRKSQGSDGDAGLADRLGESLDVAVVLVAAAVEDGFGDAGLLGPLGQQFAGLLRGLGFAERPQLGLEPGDGRQGPGG